VVALWRGLGLDDRTLEVFITGLDEGASGHL
jgi:hypothetical protein